MLTSGLGAKNVELLKELVPTAAVIACLVNPSNPSTRIYAQEAVTAANALGIAVPVLNASTEHDLDEAFASLAKLGAGQARDHDHAGRRVLRRSRSAFLSRGKLKHQTIASVQTSPRDSGEG